jgi:hypothetical protein
MKTRKILVVSNFPPPLPDVTTLGPGLRAFSLARGLVSAGHKVSLSYPEAHKLPERVVREASRKLALPIKPVRMTKLGEFILEGMFEFVILTNYHGFRHIIDGIEQGRFRPTRFLYDFFAPRLLEEASDPQADKAKIAEWTSLKHRALRVSGAVLVNGLKKLPYAMAWLLASKANLRKPLVPVGFAIDTGTKSSPVSTNERDFSVLPPRAFIAGNQQRWTDSQLSTVRLLQALADNRWELVVCGTPELTNLFANSHIADRFATMKIESYADLPFDAFCDRQASCDLIIDAFTRSPERELAYVTRTAVALADGLPAIHPRWTETGEIIKSYGAGWLYESDKEIPKIIEWISSNPHDLSSKKNGAAKLRQRQLNEACSIAHLCSFLEAEDNPRRGHEIRKRVNRTTATRTAFFLHSALNPEWYAIRYGLPFIDVGEARADYYERHATAERSPPNFLLAYLQERLKLGDLRLLEVPALISALEGWLDTPWLRSRFSLEPDSSSERVALEYFRRAIAPGCDPNRFFCESFYSSYYADAAASVRLGAFTNGYDHYLSVGQKKGYLPSPFLIPQPRDLTVQERGTADLFASAVTNVANIIDSPTPFFDLDFWRQSSPGQRDNMGLGSAFLTFIDDFFVPGVFGSAFHREILTTKLSNRTVDRLKTARQRALEQSASIPSGALEDLIERLDAQSQRKLREATEQTARHAWALELLRAYGQRAEF